ncbi:MAG: hypothetical protein U5J95_09975 [Balneolaceae bacterium]|nr:hypothetical protein [Balneolaceae bacterium]
MLDRSHNFGGTYYNRGLFRRNVYDMGPEHNLDLLTYRYKLFDDYDWITAQNAYRVTFGSLGATNFLMENSIKSDIDVGSSGTVMVQGYHAENVRANRILFYLGYEHDLGGNHHLGLNQTLTKDKSDLDATFYYRYGNFADGMAKISFTALDWISNVVQKLDKDGWASTYKSRGIVQRNHQYSTKPKLISINLTSPQYHGFRAELLGGVQTYSKKTVTENIDTLNYVDEEWAHYLGTLVEYSNDRFTAGITYQRTFSRLDREPAEISNYQHNFVNRQVTNHWGAFGSARYKSFRIEQWLWYEFNKDRIAGTSVPDDLSPITDQNTAFNYVEKRVTLKSGIYRDPVESGFRAGLEFHAAYTLPQGEKAQNGVRNFNFRQMYPIIQERNERLTFSFGYRFSKRFYFLAGWSLDLDRDTKFGNGLPRNPTTFRKFDGGFGRFSINW